MRESRKSGAKVRGTCKAGHVTERTADPGRVTWNGECPTDGCSETVRCKRVSSAEHANAEPVTTTDSRIRRVKGYERPSKRARVGDTSGSDAGAVTTGESAGAAATGGVTETSTAPPGFDTVSLIDPDDEGTGIFPGW